MHYMQPSKSRATECKHDKVEMARPMTTRVEAARPALRYDTRENREDKLPRQMQAPSACLPLGLVAAMPSIDAGYHAQSEAFHTAAPEGTGCYFGMIYYRSFRRFLGAY